MASIKDLKKKIKSTQGTLKITQAMKFVSAAKLGRARNAIMQSRPYTEELQETIHGVLDLRKDYDHPYLRDQENDSDVSLIVISSEKGLCGGYNSQLAKKILKYLERTDMKFKINFIGRKVRELIENKVNGGHLYSFKESVPSFLEIKDIAERVGESFRRGEVKKVFIAYNVFHSSISFTSTIKQILPFPSSAAEKKELSHRHSFDFKYEPSPKIIMDDLIPKFFIMSFYGYFLDALASEYGSRMTSMESAVNNCREAIRSLSLKMNKLRQAAITTELIEVVSGAESLND